MMRSPLKVSRRSSFYFATGLCLAAGISVGADGLGSFVAGAQNRIFNTAEGVNLPLASRTELTANDIEAAKIAWSYIAANTVADTGLVNSVAGIKSTTLWDQGSYVFGLIATHKIGIITPDDFAHRTETLLTSLSNLPLFEGALPNKVYRTDSLEMTNYTDVLTPEGIGWSALDMARLLQALAALQQDRPEIAPQIRALLATWNLTALSHNGELMGTSRTDGVTRTLQEGRIGYKQYAARAAALWGLDVSQALSANRIVRWRKVEGVDVATDLRTPESFGAINPVLGEPYFLQALELGMDSEGRKLADHIYLAQLARYENTGILTAVSEDHIDQEPYFIYSSVYSNGKNWAVVSEAGEHYPHLRTLSSKAAFAWDVIYGTEYTQTIRGRIENLPPSEKGWPAGVYEETGNINAAYTLNTNAIILEALHYKAFGPLWALP